MATLVVRIDARIRPPHVSIALTYASRISRQAPGQTLLPMTRPEGRIVLLGHVSANLNVLIHGGFARPS